MYLTRKKYVGAEYGHRNVTGDIKIKIGEQDLPINFDKVSYIEESAMYWRKANAIHKWFVDTVQDGVDDCREYYVSKENLEELLRICEEIEEKVIMKDGKIQNGSRMTENGWEPIMEDGKYVSNPEICEELLPTESGCFFGSTNYDEYYMQDIEYTINELTKLLKDEEKLNENKIYSEFFYQSSW